MSCEECRFRTVYDKKPGSLLGKIWRFHIGFCPGWKKYMNNLPDSARREIAEKYGQKKYLS